MFSLSDAKTLLYLTTTLEECVQRMRSSAENDSNGFFHEKKQCIELQQQIDALCKQQIGA